MKYLDGICKLMVFAKHILFQHSNLANDHMILKFWKCVLLCRKGSAKKLIIYSFDSEQKVGQFEKRLVSYWEIFTYYYLPIQKDINVKKDYWLEMNEFFLSIKSPARHYF